MQSLNKTKIITNSSYSTGQIPKIAQVKTKTKLETDTLQTNRVIPSALFSSKETSKKRFRDYENTVPETFYNSVETEVSNIIRIRLPVYFDINDFRSVKNFLDGLNSQNLEIIFNRRYILRVGDLQNERIKEHFRIVCTKKRVNMTKKRKSSKIVKEWNF